VCNSLGKEKEGWIRERERERSLATLIELLPVIVCESPDVLLWETDADLEQEAHEGRDVFGDRIGRVFAWLGSLRGVQFAAFVRLEVESGVTAKSVGRVCGYKK
jgi:hypothetical protein